MRRTLFTALLAFAAGSLPASASCGANQQACQTELGAYHLELPDEPDGAPVVMFLHGLGGSGAGTIRNKGLVQGFTARGYAFIAPTGLPRPGLNRTAWSFHPDLPNQRDEVAFFQEIVAELADNHGIDPDRVLLGGFSIGGSMAAFVACKNPAAFAAYAPVAGGLWRPYPGDCKGPVRMLHTHGWTDKVMPLEGRPVGDGSRLQGDVFATMELWRGVNGCPRMQATTSTIDDQFWRRAWSRCAPGSALELALHDGGHGVPKGWAAMAIDWFEKLDKPRAD